MNDEILLVLILLLLWLHLFYNLNNGFGKIIMINKINNNNDVPLYWPLSISHIHSETLQGRQNLSCLWTALGFILYKIDNSNFATCHIILCILSLFPNSEWNGSECVIIFNVNNYICTVTHSIIVCIYLLVIPIIRIIFDCNIIFAYIGIIGFVILLPLFYYNNRWSSLIEASILTAMSLCILHN